MKPRGRTWNDHLFLLLASLLFVTSCAPLTQAQNSSGVQAQIAKAYSAVLQADRSGADVSSLVSKLNSAIALYQQANSVNTTNPSRALSLYSQAALMAQQVIQAAPAVASAGAASVGRAQLDLGIETVVLAALAVLAYIYTPRLFWRFWLRTRRNWRVKKR